MRWKRSPIPSVLLEFEDHRPLYDWFIEQLPVPRAPQQIEFARLNLTYTMMSKRKLLQLVERGIVQGWDDPRMPTIAGLRRRGYTPAAIRDFCERIGVAKSNSMVDIALLEHCLREDLNKHAPRVMGVLRPLKVVIENYPEGQMKRWKRSITRKIQRWGFGKYPSLRFSILKKTILWKIRPRSFTVWHQDGKSVYGTDTSLNARTSLKTRRGRSSSSVVLTIRRQRGFRPGRTESQSNTALGFRRPCGTGGGSPV